jgi:hypothetical protein
MNPPTAGYSGTPLPKKLGISPGSRVFLKNAPANYHELVIPLPENVTFEKALTNETDIVHVFTDTKSVLQAELRLLRASIRSNCVIWISWPKKASKVATDITENIIRELALPIGLVDVKVCAVSDVWSGLKLVIRKEFR